MGPFTMKSADSRTTSRSEVFTTATSHPDTGESCKPDEVIVRGARQHNLKNIEVRFPRNRLVVITGPSGSGKSSLALDTVFAEAQRRYIESLGISIRQFIHQLPKPDIDSVEGLSPAICIKQQHTVRNPRSTVGTVTELYDFLRLFYARLGQLHCPKCGKRIYTHTVQQIVDRVLDLPQGTQFSILAPIVRGRTGDLLHETALLRKEGFVRASIDGRQVSLEDNLSLDKTKRHTLDVYVDRLAVKPEIRQRLTESVELALRVGGGVIRIAPVNSEEITLSEIPRCIECGVSLPEINARIFSFNHPEGACSECGGLGEKAFFDPDLAVSDPSLSLHAGAITAWGKADGAFYRNMLDKLCESIEVDVHIPWKALAEVVQKKILWGSQSRATSKASTRPGGFEGVIPGFERRARTGQKRAHGDEDAVDLHEEELDRFMSRAVCQRCGGTRLSQEALSIKVDDKNISQITALPLDEVLAFFQSLTLSARETAVAEPIAREVTGRIRFIHELGLGYLTLNRPTHTLSSGENRRIRLANQIGSGLVGVLYVLDEPSIGLHARDIARLIKTLCSLRDRGNTVLVVEHDADTIAAADYVVDMGPAAGRLGGEVTACGTPTELGLQPRSLTGQYLSGRRCIRLPASRRPITPRVLTLQNATTNNLAGVTVEFPLGLLICVTGVSGSGKSSLVMDTLLPAVKQRLGRERKAEVSAKIVGVEQLDNVIPVDQAPIGRTPRSNPATYTGVLSAIRELYAGLPEARARGYTAARFSYNVKGGRCEACRGDGVLRVEMSFLPDVYVRCEVCDGQRYNRETLEIRYRGMNIAQLLSCTVDEAFDLLAVVPKIRDQLAALRAVGLGYIQLGQSATTLSGGEAQRLKLSRELARKNTGRTLYILDEPTTGLHFHDIELLMEVLGGLVDAGNTVLIIEHNLDVIKLADYVIDMGPEGGSQGGRVVARGTPEQVAEVSGSYTGGFLKRALRR